MTGLSHPPSSVRTVTTGGVRGPAARWPPRTWPRPVLTAVAAVVAGAAFVTGFLGGAATGTTRWALLAGGTVLAMVAVALSAEERARSRLERATAEQVGVEAEARLQLAVNQALAPLTGYLAALPGSGSGAERSELVGQLRQAVVDAAVRLSGPRARATYYRLVPHGDALERVTYAGRPDLPRERFEAGTPDGDTVLAIVRQGRTVLVPDVVSDPVVTPRSPGYRTIVGVAVGAGDRPVGLLSVDCPSPGDLQHDDLALLRVLANLLAAGDV